MWRPKRLNIGDIVCHQNFGIGRVVSIDKALYVWQYQYLVYYYKENKILHSGDFGGKDCHYWWNFAEDLLLVPSLHYLIERRQHG